MVRWRREIDKRSGGGLTAYGEPATTSILGLEFETVRPSAGVRGASGEVGQWSWPVSLLPPPSPAASEIRMCLCRLLCCQGPDVPMSAPTGYQSRTQVR
ncbi:hypothetical protein COCNU_contig69507815G000010 [Cocos nucifera]|nr:hypothetical protein [Cocos nucifera]